MHLPIAEPPVALAKGEAERQLIGEERLPGALVGTELLSREASRDKRRADRFCCQPCRQESIVDSTTDRGLHLFYRSCAIPGCGQAVESEGIELMSFRAAFRPQRFSTYTAPDGRSQHA